MYFFVHTNIVKRTLPIVLCSHPREPGLICTLQPQIICLLWYSQAAIQKKKMAQRLSPQPPNPHFQSGNKASKADQQGNPIK